MAIRVSVLVPCLGPVAATRACISSLARHTRPSWELIALDDATADGTAHYLAGAADLAVFPLRVLTNPRPLGFVGSWQRAIDVSNGEVVVFLRGDAVVVNGWLDQLLALADSRALVGLCGPMSNGAEPPQRVEPIPYADLPGMQRFASEWRAQHRGQWFTADRLTGPCLLIRRPILDAVGGLGAGIEDLCMRANAAGHGMAVAHDLFLHAGPLAATAFTKIVTLDAAEFARRFGVLDTSKALHGYTLAGDTHAVLTLLAHSRACRILEVGTARGHMTANLAEWSGDEARVYSLGIVRGLEQTGAPEQGVEIPTEGEFGRFADHFGNADKITLLRGDSLAFDFRSLAPLDFVFLDGGHNFEHVASDTRKAYEALAPGGWLVWHDFTGPHPWIEVREAIERSGLAEPVYHVVGTEVAFLRKGGSSDLAPESYAPVRMTWEGDWRGLHSLGLIDRELCQTLAPGPPGPRQAKVSLTMIVKNEEHNLPACLDSAKGLFDEIIVVDTGSTDRTIAIAEEHGARVFDFPWVQDYAAARNAALARATGDYAFWLDADNVVDPPQRAKLRTLLDGLRAGDEAAYVVRCVCDDGPTGGRTVVDHVRLFPLREEVRWDYAVHEQILPSLRRSGVPVRWTEVEVRHTGYANASVRAGNLRRDEAILRRELESRPGDPFVLFNLGFIAVERRDWQAALRDLSASLKGSAPSDSIVNKLYALIARCHQGLGDAASAIAACEAGRRAFPEDAELWFREGVVRRQSGDTAGAEACWKRVLTLRRPDKFSSVDSGIYGHLTRRNLAALARERGALADEEAHWQAVLAECPGDREAEAALGRIAAGGTPS